MNSAVVVWLLTCAACGGGGSEQVSVPSTTGAPETTSTTALSTTSTADRPVPTTALAQPAFPRTRFGVKVVTWNWVDATRPTSADGRSPAHAGRELPTRVFIPAVVGVPRMNAGPFPLFVWAHGLDATADYFDKILETIASYGYVVAAPTFPLTWAGAAGGTVFDDYVNQPADVSFVIGRLLDDYGPAGKVELGLVDPTRIAVGGHSLGAVTTMGLVSNKCCIDRRVKAAIEVDGSRLPFPRGAPVARATPTLFIHGDADREFPVSESFAMYAAAVPPKYLIVLHGVPHTPFGIPAATAVIVGTTVDFLDAYLKDSSVARQQVVTDSQVPGLATLSFTR